MCDLRLFEYVISGITTDEQNRILGHLRFESSVNSERAQTCLLIRSTQTSFESSVNSERAQTEIHTHDVFYPFESSVNSERAQTDLNLFRRSMKFESSVNSERAQTGDFAVVKRRSLRAV